MNIEEFGQILKSKGIIYQSSDIYGGLAGVYDYGHMGTPLKQKWCNLWKKTFLKLDDNFVEIDTGLIMHKNVFKASGHLKNFFDPIAHGEKGATARADHLVEKATGQRCEGLSAEELFGIIQKENITIQGAKGESEKITSVENLNMMFPVHMGPTKGTTAYLRPETAQSPYVNFKLQFELQRKHLPLGLALIGRVYRNEIAPRNLLLRTREVEQAELQIFFNPHKIGEHENFDEIADYELKVLLVDGRDSEPQYIKAADLLDEGLPKFYVYHMAKVQQFYFDVIGLPEENFRFLELSSDERAFYNKYHFDIEVKLNTTDDWVEIGGVHYRTDHDLAGHQKVSKVKMEVLDESTGDRIIPHVLELSFGVGRNIFILLDQTYIEDAQKADGEKRGNAIFALPKQVAPVTVGIFPLVKKEGLPELAQEIKAELEDYDISCVYDQSGSVGRRYARQDELGTPYCITVDFDSKEKGTVTIRDRDTTNQVIVPIKELTHKLLLDLKGKQSLF